MIHQVLHFIMGIGQVDVQVSLGCAAERMKEAVQEALRLCSDHRLFYTIRSLQEFVLCWDPHSMSPAQAIHNIEIPPRTLTTIRSASAVGKKSYFTLFALFWFFLSMALSNPNFMYHNQTLGH